MLALALASQAIAGGAPGSPDDTFSSDARRTIGFANGSDEDIGNAVAIQADGRIVVAGSSDQGGATGTDFAVASFKPNGGIDNTFSADGRRTIGFANGATFDVASAVAIQADGKIVVAGYSDQGGATGTDFAVARFKPNGGIDNTFSADGRRTIGFANGAGSDFASAVAIAADGRILVAGRSAQGAATGVDLALARFTPNGGIDNGFSADGRRTIGFANGAGFDSGDGMAIQGDGKIVVAGDSGQGATGTDFAVARFKPNGGMDNAFSGNGRRTIGFGNGAGSDGGNAVAIQPDGRIVVAGSSNQGGTGTDFALARFRPNGGTDNTFSADGRRTIGFANGAGIDSGDAVAIQGDGKIVVAGESGQGATGRDFALARFRPNGGTDNTFSADGRRTIGFANGTDTDSGQAVAIGGGGKIVVAGFSVQDATGFDFALARFLGG